MNATTGVPPRGRRSGSGILLLGAALIACGPAAGDADDAAARARRTGYRGIVLPEPVHKVDFTLTDTSGESWNFLRETDGFLTLLFFGYTSCPDVCPVHMANLGAVLARFPWDARSRIQVVFVTTDPERDTADRIRQWLDAIDPRFIGLRGEPAEINRIQRALRLPEAVLEERASDGSYLVGHSTQVLAFSPDGPARVTYLFGTRQADWEHDLPKLLRAHWGS